MNWGDADMINLYDQDNNFIAPEASKKEPLGPSYEYHMNDIGVTLLYHSQHSIDTTEQIQKK